MPTEAELWALLTEVDGLPRGSAQVSALERVIRHADARGLVGLGVRARLRAVTAYLVTSQANQALAAFLWCLHAHDEHPEELAHEVRVLMRAFTTAVTVPREFPGVPLPALREVSAEMERRYREVGYGPREVYETRFQDALHLGDVAEARTWFTRWRSEPLDEVSDCWECETTDEVDHLVGLGDHEDAAGLGDLLLARGIDCPAAPKRLLESLIAAYLELGRFDDAAMAHLRSYPQILDALSMIPVEHVSFCALTGNEGRGLEIVQRFLHTLDAPPAPGIAMGDAAAVAQLLRRVVARGGSRVTLHRRAWRDRPAGPVTAEDLLAETTDTARAIAAAFDARNGSTAVSGRVERILDREPCTDGLRLTGG
ncbi:MAG: hypothetical protein GXX79_16560 [Actinomycetales bacterium]|nr:hypothetical protein [Actinomycetales bacterium]